MSEILSMNSSLGPRVGYNFDILKQGAKQGIVKGGLMASWKFDSPLRTITIQVSKKINNYKNCSPNTVRNKILKTGITTNSKSRVIIVAG